MEQPDATVVVRIAGEGGEGTITLGDLFTRIAAVSGLEVYSFRTYPAEIRGGQVMYQTRLGVDRVMTEGDEANILVAMNQQAWIEEHEDLCRNAAIIHEAHVQVPNDSHRSFPVPAEAIALELKWTRGKNFVLLGALSWFFRLDLDVAANLVRQRMKHHPESLEKNLAALRRGYTYSRQTYPEPFPFSLELPDTVEERILLSGADAMALGALAAGCDFYAGYPITPATPTMESLAKFLPAFGGKGMFSLASS